MDKRDQEFQILLFNGVDPRVERCLAIRRTVFIEEQRVPEAEELDDLDGSCFHLLATSGDGEARADIGTARFQLFPQATPPSAKAQRVAVLAGARRRGIGERLMEALELAVSEKGGQKIALSAQLSAIPFYEYLGYCAHGPVYMDAGIPHRDMERIL
ncbi:MAG: GNAT family N-acetyltransferase [Arenicellales bacterium]|jgi:ElaA protein|nr:hypothetical protein [Acidiferrobacteraceae bacterium]MDP6122810.1 GNAT family N-acetyltransferase [Arenicellales bacterium]MDP6289307.1 GNAT family N-acetyltransferase [Arenicellales bacterium]MDP7155278.1 GNAT family N-acetyltransferase [Arenicellales bacterium]MDP7283219.1 GNAT family N-acetyltransferase [Arenicellales bacterium]|tara:strand:+ start:3218 stop:3688 length:471 start_codon:yes stop_codon:yes gene_type:complete